MKVCVDTGNIHAVFTVFFNSLHAYAPLAINTLLDYSVSITPAVVTM